MVHIFGRKLGGERKKGMDEMVKPVQIIKRVDQNTIGRGQYFGREEDTGPVSPQYAASVRSVKSQTCSSSARTARKSQYGSDSHDLNPGRQNSLAPPMPVIRPSSSGRAETTCVNPMDVYFNRCPSNVEQPSTQPARSHSSKEFTSYRGPNDDGLRQALRPPPPLRSRSMAPNIPTARGPPSPPQSVEDFDRNQDDVAAFGKGSGPFDADKNALNGVSPATGPPTGYDKNRALGPMPLPSPAPSITNFPTDLVPQTSSKAAGVPMIRNVSAKRTATTISSGAGHGSGQEIVQRSFSESAENVYQERPKTSGGSSTKRTNRPTELHLNINQQPSDRNGPHSAPIIHRAKSSGGLGTQNMRSPRGLYQPDGTLCGSFLERPALAQYSPRAARRISANSSIYSIHSERSDGPDSPVMPLSGPLASPLLPPSQSQSTSPVAQFIVPLKKEKGTCQPRKKIFEPAKKPYEIQKKPTKPSISRTDSDAEYQPEFKFPDWSVWVEESKLSKDEEFLLKPFKDQKTFTPTPSDCWPLPSPKLASLSCAPLSLTPKTSAPPLSPLGPAAAKLGNATTPIINAHKPFHARTGSIPRLPAARVGSPFQILLPSNNSSPAKSSAKNGSVDSSASISAKTTGNVTSSPTSSPVSPYQRAMPSFSRPWTPSNVRPGTPKTAERTSPPAQQPLFQQQALPPSLQTPLTTAKSPISPNSTRTPSQRSQGAVAPPRSPRPAFQNRAPLADAPAFF